MENVSAVTSFILAAYAELEDHRYLYSSWFFVSYILIIFSNSVLIVAISTERGLHEPMYFFICSLSVNALYCGTCVFPSILKHLLSCNYNIYLAHCVLQLYCVHSCSVTEFTVLAAMSYDRYVAICHPLHYHLLMSPKKLYAAITLSWVAPSIFMIFSVMFTIQHTFCGRIIEDVFCTNFALVKLFCFDTTTNGIYRLAIICVTPGPQIILIVFTYVEILKICWSASWESQKKALQTCTPHFLALIIFLLGGLAENVLSRFNLSHGKSWIFMSLSILIIPPVFNPVIYGISNQAIRVHIFKLFSGKKIK